MEAAEYKRALEIIRSVRRGFAPGRFDRVFYDTRKSGNRAKLQGDPALVACVANALLSAGIACELFTNDLGFCTVWCVAVQSGASWQPAADRNARTSPLLKTPVARKPASKVPRNVRTKRYELDDGAGYVEAGVTRGIANVSIRIEDRELLVATEPHELAELLTTLNTAAAACWGANWKAAQ